MNRNETLIAILKDQVVPALGCTEPIAIAYAGAKARQLLGVMPEHCRVRCSGNIIKNVKSVVVPNTNSLKGIEAAAAAGIVAGQSDKILEVISEVTPAQRAEIRVYLADHPIVVKPAEGDKVFDILITLRAGNNNVKLRISDYHTHIVYIEKNGEVLFQSGEVLSDSARDMLTDRSCLSGVTAALYVDDHIKLSVCLGSYQRLTNNHLQGLQTKILVDVSLIYGNIACTWYQIYSCN